MSSLKFPINELQLHHPPPLLIVCIRFVLGLHFALGGSFWSFCIILVFCSLYPWCAKARYFTIVKFREIVSTVPGILMKIEESSIFNENVSWIKIQLNLNIKINIYVPSY